MQIKWGLVGKAPDSGQGTMRALETMAMKIVIASKGIGFLLSETSQQSWPKEPWNLGRSPKWGLPGCKAFDGAGEWEGTRFSWQARVDAAAKPGQVHPETKN